VNLLPFGKLHQFRVMAGMGYSKEIVNLTTKYNVRGIRRRGRGAGQGTLTEGEGF
jgi:hypothetical protein